MPPRKPKPAPGTVYARGDRWVAQQPPSGGRRAETFDTEEAAWEWLKRAHARRVLLGGDVEQAGATPLGDGLDVWLGRLAVKESTR